ncbi:A/G-specific adenine glycosylase [Bryobacter aggregatus]|uniref:A/G-specific adenine glycosylase n=1 Tax=Bryobacter aggregatus TaxID=360054 RepID=UPI00068C2B4D|nr:A/G-specific adenine glycosylase [Bryobacter aggregatus]
MRIAPRLKQWFDLEQRDLPWRRTRDPYRIWLSEIMLQQTRVAAVIPYYERFLEKYPDYTTLAAAPEDELLGMWQGLGYYSRARNLQKAAQQMVKMGRFPSTYAEIRELPGVGDYTAAAVASIAFGLPEIGLDGNIVRVMARWTAEKADVRKPATRAKLLETAREHLDKKNPGTYKQSLMELGATICLPKAPKCLYCPINDDCGARLQGLADTLPIQLGKRPPIDEPKAVFWVVHDKQLLLWQRPANSQRLRGFWELPEAGMINDVEAGRLVGEFTHSIVNHRYRVQLFEAKLQGDPGKICQWIPLDQVDSLTLSTIVRKCIKLFN